MRRPNMAGRAVRLLAAVLACVLLFAGCERGTPADGTSEKEDDITGKNEDISVRNGTIKDIFMDKARYSPGEQASMTVELCPEGDGLAELRVRVTHLAEEIFASSAEVELKAGQTSRETLTLTLPAEDFVGYSVEAYLLEDGKCVDWEMTAAEVASDWSKYPRYGYLTKYGNQTEEEIGQTLERLNKFHITGLFYYDVLNRHEKPLAGTVDDPDEGWKTLANHYASLDTVQKLIDIGHEYNMNSYLYNLIFGAYEDYEASGVEPEWGLYKDKEHTQQDYHGDFADSWATRRLYIFDPSNVQWQDYYLKVTREALQVFGYDGLQIDSLGSRGRRYNYEGGEVDLQAAYSPLLNRLADELGTRVIFNPVSGYGLDPLLSEVDYDIFYEEVWPGDGGSYGALKYAVDSVRTRMRDDKGMVIAAYMDYNKSDGAFNTPGVLLTDAVLMASGAAHLELGDTGMLKSEYYPGKSLRIDDTLEAALRNYYSFMVAYENLLREPAYRDVVTRTYVNGKAAAMEAVAGKIWSFTKENENGDQVIHFINLSGVSSTDWVDAYGKQETPEKQYGLTVKQYVRETPEKVLLASPDLDEGIMQEVKFEVGSDGDGTFITFQMPELDYWNMAVIKLG